MNIYISLDMEGMPGTWNWHQEKSDPIAVKKAVYSHVKDVIEAIQDSCKDDDVDEIVIADSHGKCDSLSYEITEIDRRIKLISGQPRPNFMIPCFDEKFDMAFLLGYHSGFNSEKGNMAHSYASSKFHKIFINEEPMDETLINAAYISCFATPVTLVSGDLTMYKHVKDKLPWIEFVATKEGIAHLACINYSASVVRQKTKQSVEHVMANSDSYKDKLYTFDTPIKLNIEFKTHTMADVASYMPYCNRIDGRTVAFASDDYKTVFKAILALRALAISAG